MAGIRLSLAVAIALAASVHGLRLADEEQANATDAANAANTTHMENLIRPPIRLVRPVQVKWTYFPPEPRLGIVTGGTPEEYEEGSHGQKAALILMTYAKKKGYALYVDRNIGRYTARHHSWAKLHVMHQLLDDVPLLVWIDPDVLLTDMDFSLETLIKQSPCKGAQQLRWDQYFPEEVQDDTFLWLSADTRQGGMDQYAVNTAPGIMVLRSGPEAKEFLERVWRVGEIPNYYARHSYAARKKEGQAGEWPYEQGAIWDVLAGMPSHYMRKACIAPVGHLHSLTDAKWKDSMALRRLTDKNLHMKNKIADDYLRKFNLAKPLLKV
mmetsp:Transcript_120363/g.374777  ORF Transcript_120363/g.374777 Transcript_120363/m.374777 type:complete len:325 (+) Transcript_120363:96-1070(+)